MKYEEIISLVKRRFPNEPEYLQAVEEVIESIEEVYNQHPEFEKANLVERLIIPDKIHTFRVTWVDDKGNLQKRAYHTSHGWCQGRVRLFSTR